jgi:hypothetical protein
MREGYRALLREVLHVSDSSMSLLTVALCGGRGDDVVNPTDRMAFSSSIYEARREAYERSFQRDVGCLSHSGRPTGSLRHSGNPHQHCSVVEKSEGKIIDVNDPLISS